MQKRLSHWRHTPLYLGCSLCLLVGSGTLAWVAWHSVDPTIRLVCIITASTLAILCLVLRWQVFVPTQTLLHALEIVQQDDRAAFQMFMQPVRPNNTEIGRLLSTFHSMAETWIRLQDTMQERIEERTTFLVDMQSKFRRIVDNLPGVVFNLVEEKTGKMHFTFVSDQVIDILGYTPTQMYQNGELMLHGVLPEDQIKLMNHLHRSREDRLPCQCDYQVAVNGKIRWLHVDAMPSFAEQDQTAWDGVIVDITPQKTAERELQEYKNNLEQRVEDQTRDIIEAKERAEKANQAKTQFLSNVSHELRTPMHAILSFSALGRQRLDAMSKEKIGEYFDDIHNSGKRLLSLVDDLLDLTRLEAKKFTLVLAPHSLRTLIADVTHDLQPLADKKEMQMTVDIAEDITTITCDAKRITQVILNLVGNAIKYAPPHSTVTIAAQQDATTLHLSVSDQGSGVPEEEIPQLFNTFIQASTARITPGGTGLGLAICREIIQLHQGTITAENIPGSGLCVRLALPLLEQA